MTGYQEIWDKKKEYQKLVLKLDSQQADGQSQKLEKQNLAQKVDPKQDDGRLRKL